MTDERLMTIPEIRAELESLAVEHGLPRLKELADQTWRRKPLRIARAKRATPDEAKAQAIRDYYYSHPDASLDEIADIFGTTNGRVSEAIRGKRGE